MALVSATNVYVTCSGSFVAGLRRHKCLCEVLCLTSCNTNSKAKWLFTVQATC